MKKNEQAIHGDPVMWKRAFIALAVTLVLCAALFFVCGHVIYGLIATALAILMAVLGWQAHNNISELAKRDTASDTPAPIAQPVSDVSVDTQLTAVEQPVRDEPAPAEHPVCAEPAPAEQPVEYVPRKGTRGYLRYRQEIVEDALVEAERMFSAAEKDEDVFLAEKDEYEKALAAARARRQSK